MSASQILSLVNSIFILAAAGFALHFLIEQEQHLPTVLLLSIGFFVWAFILLLYFLVYAFKNQTISSNRKNIKDFFAGESREKSNLVWSLLGYFLALIELYIISFFIYKLSLTIIPDYHVYFIFSGNFIFFLSCLWSARHEKFYSNLQKALLAGMVFTAFTYLFFYLSTIEPLWSVSIAMITAWIIPVYILVASIKNKIKKLFSYKKSNILDMYSALWDTSNVFLRKHDRVDQQAIAISLIILIFIIPEYISLDSLLPEGLTRLISQSWVEIAPPFLMLKKNVGYITLGIFIVVSALHLVSKNLGSGYFKINSEFFIFILFDNFMKSILAVFCVFIVGTLMATLVLISIHIFQEENIVIIIGLFTFPSWTQRLTALLLASLALIYKAHDTAVSPKDPERLT